MENKEKGRTSGTVWAAFIKKGRLRWIGHMWKGWKATELRSESCMADQEEEEARKTLVEVVRRCGGGFERVRRWKTKAVDRNKWQRILHYSDFNVQLRPLTTQ
jgi:hypothetical protein